MRIAGYQLVVGRFGCGGKSAFKLLSWHVLAPDPRDQGYARIGRIWFTWEKRHG